MVLLPFPKVIVAMGDAFRAALLAVACICALAKDEYVALEKCAQAESCMYTYGANQASSMSGSETRMQASSNVEVFCDSVGKYGAVKANRYCLHVKDLSLSSGKETNILSEASSNAERLLNGPFCFVQTEEGKVVSVYHDPNESEQVVNFKKGIAAAFQANFKNTRVEVEEDTQSKHYSRYSYEWIAPDHVRMHRVVDSDDVIQFASKNLKGKSIKIERIEDVEYKAGKLISSAGTTMVNANGPIGSGELSFIESTDGQSTPRNDANTYDSTFGSGGLAGSGRFTLRLQSCSKKTRSLQRRSAELPSFLTASKLHAIVQRAAEERDLQQMRKLRESVPSVRDALNAVKENLNDSARSTGLKNLIILEAQHGPMSGYQPAIMEVMDYLKSEDDLEMRALLHSFLAADGSLKSQEILLEALKAAIDRKERNSLCVQLAFVRNLHSDIVEQIEKLIASTNDTTDPLILAYGAIAASSPEQKERVVQFLQERMNSAKDNLTSLIHLVHSLGNTESSSADSTLLQLIAHDNYVVRLAAVYALRYSVESKDVQAALANGLRNPHDTDFAEMVLRALIAGAESKQETGPVPVGDATFEAILQHAQNNTDLRSMVHYYVLLLGPKAPKQFTAVLGKAVQKRGTKWDDNSDSVYNLVEDYSTRQTDLTNYPTNRAYIWGKSLGVPDIKLDLAFGAFAGYGGKANPTSFKVFGRAVARGYAFGRTATVFEALISSENKPGGSSISNRLYINIVGKVLVDYSKEIPTCKTWTYPLYKSPDYTLLSFTYSVFIFIGTLDFSISLGANLGVDASLTVCLQTCVSAKAAVTPYVTLIATAGASVTVIEAARIGVDIQGTFQYKIQPQITGNYHLPTGTFELCLALMHGWPNNGLSLYVYYQLRKILWCPGWWGLSWPCGLGWGDKNKWEALSKDWALPSSDLTPLWTNCDPAKLQCSISRH